MDGSIGPMELPTRMQYRFREINKILKQTVYLVPNNGQADVNAGDTIIVELPQNSVVDFSTFVMDYTGETTEGAKAQAGAVGFRQTRFFPRNTASIIEQLDVEINGQTRFTLNNYGFVYNTLFDLTAAQDSLNRRKVGENADPSSKYVSDPITGTFSERRGYSIALTGTDAAKDKENYIIRSWLGLLNPSTSILDTNILGSVVIKIRLAPPTCLILGAACGAAITAVTDVNASDTGILTTGVASTDAVITAAAAVAETTANYTLSNVKFTIVRYDLPTEFYQLERAKLASGAVFKIWFPNYTVQSCTSVLAVNKQGVNRTSISCRSLDWVMGTFRLPTYTTIGGPLNSLETSLALYGTLGQNVYTFDSQVRAGARRLFNNSRYFARNGTSINNCSWQVGMSLYPARNLMQQYEGVLQHFNIQNDQGSGGMYPGIQSINHFRETFYCDILSLNCNQSEADYVISGLNTQETPLQITWNVNANSTASSAIDTLIPNTTDTCIPYLICGYTSCLEVRGGRQITVIQ
jgi:hypothetical protein